MYAPVTVALEELSSRETATPLSSSVPLNPGPPTERAEPDKPDPRKEVSRKQFTIVVFSSSDTTLALFDRFDHRKYSDPVELSSP